MALRLGPWGDNLTNVNGTLGTPQEKFQIEAIRASIENRIAMAGQPVANRIGGSPATVNRAASRVSVGRRRGEAIGWRSPV